MLKYNWLKKILEDLKPIFTEVFIGSLFINLLAIAVPIFVLQVYDRVISHSGISTLQGLMLGMLGVIFFDFILRQTRSKLMQRVAVNLDVKVNDLLFTKITSLPLQKIESTSGSYWHLLFQDITSLRNALSGHSAILACDLPFALIFIFFIFIIASPIAWILVLIFFIFSIIAWKASESVTEASRSEKKNIVTKESLLSEIISARSTIKSLNFTKKTKHDFDIKQEASILGSMTRGNRTDFFMNLGHSLTITTTVILTTAGAISIINKELTIGALIATNMLAGRLLGPLNQLIGTWRILTNLKESLARLDQLFNIKNESYNSSINLQNIAGEIKLENASFKYHQKSKPALDRINLYISSNSINTIIGPNSSGKTTLLKTILGLYHPFEGRVILDGADIKQIGRKDLANLIGYVPQETFLFDSTIKENILWSNTNIPDDQVIKICESINLHKTIIDMPDGYGTIVGEQGQNLSSGVRKKVAIARSLVGNPKIIIMDEPTNNLDQESERVLTRLIFDLSKYKSIIIVSHSQSIIDISNNLILMNNSKIIKSGMKEEVIKAIQNL
ncbi:MAG: ATP-binding cassette domain-containing protein [Pseudomonadota bacterium]|nr:ATP-binding cassette domain-containing protein [Pseudomonadota bacterium]